MTPDQQKALDIQNEGRKKKSLAPLTYDAKLEADAQWWAKHLARKVGHMEHSKSADRPGQGENLFWGWSSPKAYADPYKHAAKAWMNEATKYHGEKIGKGKVSDYGHYTQCMWKSTQKIGMGCASDNKGGVFVVARYSPPGNYVGKTPY